MPTPRQEIVERAKQLGRLDVDLYEKIVQLALSVRERALSEGREVAVAAVEALPKNPEIDGMYEREQPNDLDMERMRWYRKGKADAIEAINLFIKTP